MCARSALAIPRVRAVAELLERELAPDARVPRAAQPSNARGVQGGMRVIISGATGFVGRALTLHLLGRGGQVTAWVRDVDRARGLLGADVACVAVGDGRDPVCELFNAIARDPRHHTVRLLRYEEIAERRFAGWTMGQVNMARVNRSVLLKYSEAAVLDPFACTGRAAMALLDELIATAAVVA